MTFPVPELATERLVLRGWQPNDIDWVADYLTDPATAPWVGGPSARGEAWRRLASWVGHWVLRGFGLWALEEKATGAAIGYCGLWRPEEFPETELGWGLRRRWQSRGLAREAALCARDFAFGSLGLTGLVSYVAPDNLASRRLAERLGATCREEIEIGGRRACVYRHCRPAT